jgi:hypothetical protein
VGRTIAFVVPNEGGRTNKMPTAETNLALTEQELVEHWRSSELERAGYPADLAAELATRTDVDLHRAA